MSRVYRLAERRALPGHKVGRHWRFQKPLIDDCGHARLGRYAILVVDDERATRELMVRALTTTKCHVLTAASGTEALGIVTRSTVDLVVLDLTMPGMNGVDTFRAIHRIRPALPVVIVTGYLQSELMAQVLKIGPVTMIARSPWIWRSCRR